MSDLISHALAEQNQLNNKHEEQLNSFSSGSDSSEDVTGFGNENTKEAESVSPKKDRPSMDPNIKHTRSMSDGQAERLIPQEFADVFPSLPDSVLNKLGLLGGEVHREKMTEEEIEQKFVALALAFTIDATTIKDRCQRQRRYRDQTETNLTTEINRLIQKVTCIQPLCIDVRTAELLTGLLAQIDIVIRASYHAAISAERFGAVQHEDKLTEAVNLMISHVSLMKQQRESIRKQLQYTKKVLQDTNSCEKVSPKTDTLVNNKFITKRRASIATITQPVETNVKVQSVTVANGDIRRITRRSSDLSTRVATVIRQARPNRLDLGADLCKIKENTADNDLQISDESDSEAVNTTNVVKSNGLNPSSAPSSRYEQLFLNIRQTYERVAQNGSLGEFFIFAALFCFALSIIILGNVLVELELGKRGMQTDFFWKSFS